MMKMSTKVNSWKTLTDLSTPLAVCQIKSGKENWYPKCQNGFSYNLNMNISPSELVHESSDGNNNCVLHEEKKLVGILKKTEMDEKTVMCEVDDGVDEGLGDLDEVSDDFDEIYKETSNSGESFNVNLAKRSDVLVELGDGSITESSPNQSNNLDSLFFWSESPLRTKSNKLDQEFSHMCNITNDKKTLRPSILEMCNVDRKPNKTAERVISPNTKAKSVHFAIFPYVIEVPRVADLEMEFDNSDQDVNNNNTVEGND